MCFALFNLKTWNEITVVNFVTLYYRFQNAFLTNNVESLLIANLQLLCMFIHILPY